MYDFNKCLKKQIDNWDNHVEGMGGSDANKVKESPAKTITSYCTDQPVFLCPSDLTHIYLV